MRIFIILFASVMNLTLIDALVKEFSLAKLSASVPTRVINGFFDLILVKNRGCAWGMLQGKVAILAAFGAVALAALIWKRKLVFGVDDVKWRPKLVSHLSLCSEALLYAGILGNLIDRVGRGFVVDMFSFHYKSAYYFPCFNLADSYITIAVGLMIFLGFLPRNVAENVNPK